MKKIFLQRSDSKAALSLSLIHLTQTSFLLVEVLEKWATSVLGRLVWVACIDPHLCYYLISFSSVSVFLYSQDWGILLPRSHCVKSHFEGGHLMHWLSTVWDTPIPCWHPWILGLSSVFAFHSNSCWCIPWEATCHGFKQLGPFSSYESPRWSPGFLALSWPSSGYRRHLGSEPIDGRALPHHSPQSWWSKICIAPLPVWNLNPDHFELATYCCK